MTARVGRTRIRFVFLLAALVIILALAAPRSLRPASTLRPVPNAPDVQPPQTTVALAGLAGMGGWYRGPVEVSLNSTDDGTVSGTFVRLDHGAWEGYLSPFSVNTGGSHTLEFYSTDAAGNNESVHEIVLAIDGSPPGTSVSVLGTWNSTIGGYASPVFVSLQANDSISGVASIRFQIDGGSWSSYQSPFNLTPRVLHILNYSATDVAGNAESTRGVVLPVDVSYPGPQLFVGINGTLGGDGWLVSQPQVIARGLSVPGLAAAALCRVDLGPWDTADRPFTVPDGTHALVFEAIDGDNLTSALQTVTVRVDTTPPMTGAVVNGTGGLPGWYVSTVEIRLVATDWASGVASTTYSVDGGPWTPYEAPFAIGDGHHTVRYASVDRAGLQEMGRSLEVAVDTSPPAFVERSSSASVAGSSVEVSWEATDSEPVAVQYSVSVDGAPFSPVGTSTRYESSFANGDHYIIVRATNAAGLSAVELISFRVDAAPLDIARPLFGIPVYILLAVLLATVLLGSATHHRRVAHARRARQMSHGRVVRPASLPRPALQDNARPVVVRYRVLADTQPAALRKAGPHPATGGRRP